MRNEKLALSSAPSRGKFVLALLAALLLVFSACIDPLEQPDIERPPAGKGYFCLSLKENARTIIPEQLAPLSAFELYILEFYSSDILAHTEERTNADFSEPVLLDEGTYDLYVTAHYSSAYVPESLGAQGELKGLIIGDGETITHTITLLPIADSGTGSFQWNIEYPLNVTEAYMVITRMPITPETEAAAIREPSTGLLSKTGSIQLNSGYYSVDFKFRYNGEYKELREILHIYRGYTSNFRYTFRLLSQIDIEDFGVGAVISNIFTVNNTTQWNTAVSAITNGGNDKNYVINVIGNFPVAGLADLTSFTFGYTNGIKVSLRSEGNRVLNLSDNGNILRIDSYQEVILRDLHLAGRSSNNTNLVAVSGGTLTMHSGKISDNTGGGVSISGTFIMNGGQISDNTAGNGGGVYMNGGTFIMNGGTISNNTSTNTAGSAYSPPGGGGVYMNDGAVFTMNGGTITGNTTAIAAANAETGGGVFINGTGRSASAFTMYDGTISNNYGGGVNCYVYYSGDSATFVMHGGKISGNTGTGVSLSTYLWRPASGPDANACSFTMNAGEISGNTESGVYSSSLWLKGIHLFTMNGGKISGNGTIKGDGGGVNLHGGNFIMKSGEISGNTADSYGGGVYLWSGASFRIVGGTIYGSDNASLANTIRLASFTYFRGTALACETDVVLQRGTFNGLEWNGVDITTLSTAQKQYSDSYYYYSDNTIKVSNGVLVDSSIPDRGKSYSFNVATTAEWNTAVNSIAAYGNNGNYTINATANFTVPQYADTFTFGSATGVTVTIQGAGRTLTLSGNGNILNIGSGQTVTLQDITLQGHSENNYSLIMVNPGGNLKMEAGAKICGNAIPKTNYTRLLNYGAGIRINSGTFTMNGGEISGNNLGLITGGSYYDFLGAGVYMDGGTFTMNAGEISGNNARNSTSADDSSRGGGVYVNTGTFIMNGGKISGNTARGTGGGVYVNGTFIMNDGEISDNASLDYRRGGDGVYVNNGTFTMHKGKISNHTSVEANGGGVYVNTGTFNMNGGEISDNSSVYSSSMGIGVYINTGTFNMSGGKISGNAITSGIQGKGGGVYMNNGTFTMRGGEISGNSSTLQGGGLFMNGGTLRIANGVIYGSNEPAGIRNTTGESGAALFRFSGTIQYGTFNGVIWNIRGELNTSDNTIRVTNGYL